MIFGGFCSAQDVHQNLFLHPADNLLQRARSCNLVRSKLGWPYRAPLITFSKRCGQWRQSRQVYCSALLLALTLTLEPKALASAMARKALRASVCASVDGSSDRPVLQQQCPHGLLEFLSTFKDTVGFAGNEWTVFCTTRLAAGACRC